MMEYHCIKNQKKGKLLAYIFTPIAFALIWFIIIILLCNTVFSRALAYGSMVLLDRPPNFSDPVDTLFVPATDESLTALKLDQIEYPQYGSVMGQIEIESIGVATKMMYGDNNKLLKKGAGMYIGSRIPGYGGTCLVSGHNTYPFKNLKNIQIGDIIKVTTTYGVYQYEVYKTDVRPDSDKTAYDLNTDEQLLVLYTCFWVNTPIGNVKERFFAYSRMVSGPVLIH